MKIKIYGFILAIVLYFSFIGLNITYKNVQNNPEIVDNNTLFSFLYEFNNKIYDTLFKNKDTVPKTNDIFLIDIDEDSIREIGRWPWSREIVAKIWDNSFKNGVKVISNDIIFSELENTKADNQLSAVVKKYPDKIILGTFGEGAIRYENPAYQDYCFVESFRRAGGDQVVTLNSHLAFEDTENQFAQLFFTNELKAIFDDLDHKFEADYLNQNNKKSLAELDYFQKNYLISEKNRNLSSYCFRWLTPDDEYLKAAPQELLQSYKSTLNRISGYNKIANISDKIQSFKDNVQKLLIPQYASWPANIKAIQSTAENTATFNADIDYDGVIRNYPLVYRAGNKTNLSFIPSLALQTYLVAMGYQAKFTTVSKNNIQTVAAVNIIDLETDKNIINLPIDSNGRLMINYYGRKNSLPYVSARELFHSDNPEMFVHQKGHSIKVNKSEWLKNKIAIMGPTATGVFDLRNTPVAKDLPGVEIHLTMLGNLIDQNFMRVSNDELSWSAIILFFIVLTMAMAFLYSNLLIATLYLIAINYGLYKISVFQFNHNLHFSLLAPTALYTFSAYVIFLIYIYFFETKKSKEIKNTFSKYVSKEIVDEILKNQDNLQLKGQKLNMTVFFSDIRNFTTLSESMDPQELSLMLNKYFTPMSEMIFGTNGTIDKFMGDAIMALFGAPLNYPDHPQKACLAALKCITKLKEVNTEFKSRNWPELKIGIGINTGTMVAGNIGSEQIQSYTVIGDEVNLAQRLEGLTKSYKSEILISENTYLAVKDKFITREIDIVRVKGKNRPVKIYALIAEGITHSELSYYDKYHQALKLFQDNDFLRAESAFADLIKLKPDDFICRMYLDRSVYCQKNPVPENWNDIH